MRIAALLAALLAASLAAASPSPASRDGSPASETPEQFAKRTRWWREAKFGMFIHWGVYAVPADATTKDGRRSIAEWYFSNKQAQVRDYERFAAQFNPVRFD